MSPTIKDPVPGFSDSLLGGLGVVFGVSIGFVRVFPASSDLGVDVIPLDVVGNSILVIAKQTAEEGKIYNIVTNCGKLGGSK